MRRLKWIWDWKVTMTIGLLDGLPILWFEWEQRTPPPWSSQCRGTFMTNAHIAFKEAIARHYKAERDRAEDCLGDIIKILDQEGDQVEQILNRLVRHYSRTDPALPYSNLTTSSALRQGER